LRSGATVPTSRAFTSAIFATHSESHMRRSIVVLALMTATAASAHGQGLREKLERGLFSFGDCGEPLCLPALVLAGNPHGRHFIPSAEAGNAAIIAFLGSAIGANVSNIPISATTSGVTYSFEGGAPVRNNVSSGPIFAERAQTLGRRRMLIGANVSSIRFNTLRGIPLNSLDFNFTHQDINPPSEGSPAFENEFITVRTSLEVNVLATIAFATYGVTDRIDVSVAVPYVSNSIDGHSFGQIVPFGPNPAHYFAGTAAAPILSATTDVNGSASGIGDVALRAKVNLSPGGSKARTGFALLGDVRLPTGNEDDFLGSGSTSARILGIVSARYGDFAPHANAGVALRSSDDQQDAILATAGFDQLLVRWATFAFDVISEWQLGDQKFSLPGPTQITIPFARTIYPSNIPDRRDDLLNASIGTKLSTKKGLTFIVNALLPLNRGGLRASTLWTTGLEYGF
jgi:hypothetical protein